MRWNLDRHQAVQCFSVLWSCCSFRGFSYCLSMEFQGTLFKSWKFFQSTLEHLINAVNLRHSKGCQNNNFYHTSEECHTCYCNIKEEKPKYQSYKQSFSFSAGELTRSRCGYVLCCTWEEWAQLWGLAGPPRPSHPPDTPDISAAAAGTSFAGQEDKERPNMTKNINHHRLWVLQHSPMWH